METLKISYKIKKWLLFLIITIGLCSCGGSYYYAEEYKYSVTNEQLVEKIINFKQKHPEYNVLLLPDKEGDEMYNPDNRDSIFYSFYFYFEDINAAVHTVINLSKNAPNFPTKFLLTGVSFFDSKSDIHVFRHWQTINKRGDRGDLTLKENRAIKKKFEKEILSQLGEWN